MYESGVFVYCSITVLIKLTTKRRITALPDSVLSSTTFLQEKGFHAASLILYIINASTTGSRGQSPNKAIYQSWSVHMTSQDQSDIMDLRCNFIEWKLENVTSGSYNVASSLKKTILKANSRCIILETCWLCCFIGSSGRCPVRCLCIWTFLCPCPCPCLCPWTWTWA